MTRVAFASSWQAYEMASSQAQEGSMIQYDPSSYYEYRENHSSEGQTSSQSVSLPSGTYSINRELGHARVQLHRPRLELSQWYQLLESGDVEALRVKAEWDAIYNKKNRLLVLQRKLRKRPNDVNLHEQLENEFGRSIEEHTRRRKAYQMRAPMSKYKQDELAGVLKMLRSDVEKFNWMGETKRSYKSHMIQFQPVVIDEKYKEGDARADEIIPIIKQIRRVFHIKPLDENLIPLWEKLDKWMKLHQVKYKPIVRPTEYPNMKKGESKDKMASESQGPNADVTDWNDLNDVDWDAIHEQYPSQEAYINSLFHDQEEPFSPPEAHSDEELYNREVQDYNESLLQSIHLQHQ